VAEKSRGENGMVSYKESGVDLIQARGREGRFEFRGIGMRLGAFNSPEGWYVGVHTSGGVPSVRLSLEYGKTLKEAKDMLKYGFFLNPKGSSELIDHLQEIGLLSVPMMAGAPQ
jgi:hypothetical protein